MHAKSPLRLISSILVGSVLLAFAAAGCRHAASLRHEESAVPVPQGIPMRFASHINSPSHLRVVGAEWEKGDEVGIFLLPSSSGSSPKVIDGYDNLRFVREQDGYFYPSDRAMIPFPSSPKRLDIVGYHPYRALGTDKTYPLDMRENTDFLYSNSLKGFAPEEYTDAQVVFHRPLSQVQLRMTLRDETTPLSVKVKQVRIRGTFDLLTGTLHPGEDSRGDLALAVERTGAEAVVTVRLFPGEKDILFEIEYNGKSYRYVVTDLLKAGHTYTYPLAFEGEEVVVVPARAYTEIPRYRDGQTLPSNTLQILHTVPASWLYKPANGVANPRNFTVLYDTRLRMPLWVAYPLHETYTHKGVKRTNAWGYDPQVEQSLQPDLSKGWTPKGVYDRGHLMPSADRLATRELNKTTFYYTNMAAQASWFNQNSWARLEDKVRHSLTTNANDTIFVVVGCIPYPEPEQSRMLAEDASGSKSAVPRYMYKLLLRKNLTTGKYMSIAFNFPNLSATEEYTSPSVYCSVEEIEKITGFTFFPQVPQEVKRQKNLSDWQF